MWNYLQGVKQEEDAEQNEAPLKVRIPKAGAFMDFTQEARAKAAAAAKAASPAVSKSKPASTGKHKGATDKSTSGKTAKGSSGQISFKLKLPTAESPAQAPSSLKLKVSGGKIIR